MPSLPAALKGCNFSITLDNLSSDTNMGSAFLASIKQWECWRSQHQGWGEISASSEHLPFQLGPWQFQMVFHDREWRGQCGGSCFCPLYQLPDASSSSCSLSHSMLEVHSLCFSDCFPLGIECCQVDSQSFGTWPPYIPPPGPFCVSHKLGKLTRP